MYTFNKSHAVSYTWLAFQTAYIKSHFPDLFKIAFKQICWWYRWLFFVLHRFGPLARDELAVFLCQSTTRLLTESSISTYLCAERWYKRLFAIFI